jgi:hypothetical protein
VKPQATFAVFAYNQQQLVGEAVEAAFAQSYSPLEIILSDDCSTDRTFEVMSALAQDYRGPHRVVLNRNAVNFGIGRHVNHVVGLAQGELILTAAGDDVSLPERAGLTVRAWEASGRRASSIHGQWIGIDENGKPTGAERGAPWPEREGALFTRQAAEPERFLASLRPHVQGSAHAFAKRLFAEFGPLPDDIVYEDLAIAFRSVLAGEIHFIHAPLVRFRQHSSNTYAAVRLESVTNADQLGAYHAQIARALGRYMTLYDSFRKDVRTLTGCGGLSASRAAELENAIGTAQRSYRLRQAMYHAGFRHRLRMARELLADGHSVREIMPRLLPQCLSTFYTLTRLRLQRMRRA